MHARRESEGWHLLFLGLVLSLENDTKAIKEAYEFIFFFSCSELKRCIEMTCEDPLLTARSGI